MLQAQALRLLIAVSASLIMSLACSSTDSEPVGQGGRQSTSASAGGSANIGAASSGGSTTVVAGSGGSTPLPGSSSASGGAGGLTSGDGGSLGGSPGGSITTNTGGSAGRPSTETQTAGSTAAGGRTGSGGSNAGTAIGGTSASGGTRSSSGGAASGGTSHTGGSGGTSKTGGTSAAGGTTGIGGTTGPSDSLCPTGITRTITVAKDGSGQFNTVQAAVNSITSGSKDPIRIDIKAGTYTEKLTIASRTNLCMVGDSTTTILSYGDSNASTGGTSTSASVHISADDFSAANLTFQNTHGPGSQAVALRVTGKRQQFLNCRFVGYQDTLYTHNGSQYFKNCYVQGNTDFVFGGATAVLHNCEVRNVESGSAVAAPNTDAGTAFGIVFLGGKFTAASGVKSALGRPWGAAGFAAYINVNLGSHIAAAGFVAMSGNQPQNARFHEYGSTGAGANTSARSSYQLSAAQAADYTLPKIFGNWTPTYSQ